VIKVERLHEATARAYMIVKALRIKEYVVALHFKLVAIFSLCKYTFEEFKNEEEEEEEEEEEYLEILLQQLRHLRCRLIRLLPLQQPRIARGNANLPRRRHCRSKTGSN